jgi:hypothetical protein
MHRADPGDSRALALGLIDSVRVGCHRKRGKVFLIEACEAFEFALKSVSELLEADAICREAFDAFAAGKAHASQREEGGGEKHEPEGESGGAER